MYKNRTHFITHLTHIQTISKQIRTRNSNSINVKLDPECYHLWNELEKSLSSALSYANHDIQLQLSLKPLRTEIIELRK
jgi:predicted secreted Zn-dependent protease